MTNEQSKFTVADIRQAVKTLEANAMKCKCGFKGPGFDLHAYETKPWMWFCPECGSEVGKACP